MAAILISADGPKSIASVFPASDFIFEVDW